MNYTINDFIKFYEGTKDEQWCVDSYLNKSGQRCALGFCETMEPARNGDSTYWHLNRTLKSLLSNIEHINDGKDQNYQQDTPKKRVLAALYDLKKIVYPELSETTVEEVLDSELYGMNEVAVELSAATF